MTRKRLLGKNGILKTCSIFQGRNKVYGIRDQQQKMGWDQGSQRRYLGSQAVGSGSALPQRDQGFPHNNKDQKILKCALLIGGTCQHF